MGGIEGIGLFHRIHPALAQFGCAAVQPGGHAVDVRRLARKGQALVIRHHRIRQGGGARGIAIDHVDVEDLGMGLGYDGQVVEEGILIPRMLHGRIDLLLRAAQETGPHVAQPVPYTDMLGRSRWGQLRQNGGGHIARMNHRRLGLDQRVIRRGLVLLLAIGGQWSCCARPDTTTVAVAV